MRRYRLKRGIARWSGCSCRAGIQTWQVGALLSAGVKLGGCCGNASMQYACQHVFIPTSHMPQG